jgi:hypothetical protein
MSRSGSTLLDRLLGAMPDVTSLGELGQIFRRGIRNNDLCGCGRPFYECTFWPGVVEDAFGHWPGSAETGAMMATQVAALGGRAHVPPFSLRKDRRQARSEYASYLHRILAAVNARTGASVLVDSSKQATQAVVLADHPQTSVDVVHIVRDSRAVAHSVSRARRRDDAADAEAMMIQLSPAHAARSWTSWNVRASLLSRSGRTYQRLRYEDLVARPAEGLREIRQRLGLPDVALDFLRDSTARLERAHTVSGNPMRLDHGSIELRLDDEWVEAMPASTRSTVTAMTAPLLKAYGYRLSRGTRSAS